jgi:RNA polymerase sigma-70 factor, ECF subfamily
LRALAYRLLGSVADADDMVQDVYICWHKAGTDEVRSPDAWLTTVMTRLCVDRMRMRNREREVYPGSWLPEPLLVTDPPTPSQGLDMAAELSMALLVLLERLAPDERVAFLLHDAFDYDHREIAKVLGKAEPACRQLLHRARERIRTDRPRFEVSDDLCRRLITRFLDALRSADRDALISLMTENATLTSDSGGRVRATHKIVQGSDRIARLLIGINKKRIGTITEKVVLINSDVGIVTYIEHQPVALLWFETDGTRIARLYRLLNPEKLGAVPALVVEGRGSNVPTRRCCGANASREGRGDCGGGTGFMVD